MLPSEPLLLPTATTSAGRAMHLAKCIGGEHCQNASRYRPISARSLSDVRAKNLYSGGRGFPASGHLRFSF